MSARWLIPLGIAALTAVATADLPEPPAPRENPITEAKRVLGKMLFWDAQLSSDSSTACGSCHTPAVGGTEARFAMHAGFDGVYDTDDDVRGSLGVVHADAMDRIVPHAIFGVDPQVTRRAANPSILAQWAPELFWDGRASDAFVDPDTGRIVIATGGALESQALAPLVSDVEMAHADRTLDDVIDRLTPARPLALATNVPGDIAAVLAPDARYPAYFAAAFGDDEITAKRIAFALATYQRTLVPDQTRWDLGTLTPQQQAGLETFMSPEAKCTECHAPPFFSDFTFRNIGVRPIVEDAGRQEVTGDPADAGRFKVPTLRNAGLKTDFMHNGRLGTMDDVLDFYLGINGQVQFTENQDPLIAQIDIAPELRDNLRNFLRNGLIDLRVAQEIFPFDRPTLHTELLPNPATVSDGVPGATGVVPQMIAYRPPNIGNETFALAVADAPESEQAFIHLSRTTPDGEILDAFDVVGPIEMSGTGDDGYATWHHPIADDARLLGADLYAQWVFDDGARSPAVRIVFYRDDPTQCGCIGDLDCDENVGIEDLLVMLASWGACDVCGADIDDDGVVGMADLVELFDRWSGCP